MTEINFYRFDGEYPMTKIKKTENFEERHYINIIVSPELYWKIKLAATLDRKNPITWVRETLELLLKDK